MLQDAFGRRIDYLRISLIDHCNLRCVYCMPLSGLKYTPSSELLTPAEIELVVRAAASVGFRKVRLTGGEPLLRCDIVEIARRIRGVPGVADLSLTTNGMLLPRYAQSLREAGLDRVNVHIDTLNPAHLRQVMRFGTVEEIWAGIEAAEAAGFSPIKINVVVVRGYNDRDVADLARLTIDRDWHVRFIELMPFGANGCAEIAFTQFVPTAETRERIESELGVLDELPATSASDESKNHRAPGARGVIGLISPVSEPYCDTCNRIRLTADGKFHLCLLNDDEVDVKTAIRDGGGEAAVAAVLRRAVTLKPVGHHLKEGVAPRERAMFQLGG